MAIGKWYRSPWVKLVAIGAAIGGGVLLVNWVGKKVGLGRVGRQLPYYSMYGR